jgi:NAD(P)-dependent dehydrogenase (short-subunit alcohol dehydrogenase family)
MPASYSLAGKAALVTGAARGIGLETARRLAQRGASVAMLDLDAGEAREAAQPMGDRAMTIAGDVTDASAMDAAVAQVVERFGGLDVVVANAGVAPPTRPMTAVETDAYERTIEIDLLGVWRTVRPALPQVVERRGHVVVVASVYAFVNGLLNTPYAVSKAGVEQLGRSLRTELAVHGASASVAYFGFIDTEMVHRALDQDPLADSMLASIPKPLRKRLQPTVAGEAIVSGIERRAPRIVRPRRWVVMSTLRGILNPLIDRQMERDAEIQAAARELDTRAGEEQPTTA